MIAADTTIWIAFFQPARDGYAVAGDCADGPRQVLMVSVGVSLNFSVCSAQAIPLIEVAEGDWPWCQARCAPGQCKAAKGPLWRMR